MRGVGHEIATRCLRPPQVGHVLEQQERSLAVWQPRGGETVRLVDPPTEEIETIQLSVQDFVACLREGRRPIQTEVEGINVLKVILGAYASADEGRTISLRELFEGS